MRRVQREGAKGQQPASVGESINEHTVSLSMIQALIPPGLRAVEEKLQAEVIRRFRTRMVDTLSRPHGTGTEEGDAGYVDFISN